MRWQNLAVLLFTLCSYEKLPSLSPREASRRSSRDVTEPGAQHDAHGRVHENEGSSSITFAAPQFV